MTKKAFLLSGSSSFNTSSNQIEPIEKYQQFKVPLEMYLIIYIAQLNISSI